MRQLLMTSFSIAVGSTGIAVSAAIVCRAIDSVTHVHSMCLALGHHALSPAVLMLAAQITLPPPPRGYAPNAADVVVDAAGVLGADAIDRINRLAFDVKQKSGGEIAVVTLPDLGRSTAEEVALAIGREWKVGAEADIGDRSRNAAVVMLLVPKETSRDGRGHIRIEVARGAEGFITDGTAGQIRDEAMPALRAQNYSAALELIALRVAERFAAEFGFTLDSTFAPPVVQSPPVSTSFPWGGLVMLVLFLVVMAIYSRRRGGGLVVPPPMYRGRRRGGRNDWWGGGFGGFGGSGGGGWGGGGGGFGGFGGGGGFSGGGAGGSW